MKLTIIGPYPPPYGGISVHIKRIKKYLNNKGIDVEVYNESKKVNNEDSNIHQIANYKSFIFRVPFIKTDIIHFHTINKKVRILIGLYKAFNKKIILTIHGQSIHNQLENSNKITRKLLISSLDKIDRIVCVNPIIINELVLVGIKKEKLVCIPAYINPIEDRYDFNNIPQNIWSFINNSKFLISANGSIRFYNGEDLYGMDMLIELIYRLKSNGYEINLIIALLGYEVQNEKERTYNKKLEEKITRLNLNKNILIFKVKNTEFYPILKKSKIFLRPTNTDGDAISIREALYYKIPVIASDVVQRPEGTALFKTRNIDDLYKKVIDIIENYNYYKVKINDIKIKDNAGSILEVYNECLNSGK